MKTDLLNQSTRSSRSSLEETWNASSQEKGRGAQKETEEQNSRGKRKKNAKNNRKKKEPEELRDAEPEEFGDLRDQLKSGQELGVIFLNDTCSAKGLTPDLEAIALTQFTLKQGLKEFGKGGLKALGKDMEQLHTCKVTT